MYDPCADELYQAVRGFGAFVNGQRASSSDCTELGNAVVVRKEERKEGAAGESARFVVDFCGLVLFCSSAPRSQLLSNRFFDM